MQKKAWLFFCIFFCALVQNSREDIFTKGDAPHGAKMTMDIEFKRTGKPIWQRTGIYAAVLLLVSAVGFGSYLATRNSVSSVEIPTTQAPIFVPPEEPLIVVETQTQQILMTEPTTKAESTTAGDNLPFTGSFCFPLGLEILKDYSDGEMVYSQTMKDWRVHNGIDFTGEKGSEVRAIQRGRITAVYEDELWGTVVEIDHGNEMLVKYCGLTKPSVLPVGTEIKKDQAIGKLGEIPVESADEPHLHLEITVNGKIVDPLAAMNHSDE